MDSGVLVAVLSLGGTLLGSIIGILAANKLSTYRIEQLEKKVDAHNQIIERVVIIERDLQTAFRHLDEQKLEISTLRTVERNYNSRVTALEKGLEHMESICRAKHGGWDGEEKA